MRMRLPGLIDDTGCFAEFAALGQHAAGERRRGYERRRKLARLKRKRLGVVAIRLFGGERTRREHHRALPAIAILAERTPIVFKERERAGPIAGAAAKFQHRLAGPAERGVFARRFLGKSMGDGVIATASRL